MASAIWRINERTTLGNDDLLGYMVIDEALWSFMTNDTKSDTPRTDAADLRARNRDDYFFIGHMTEHTRQLERELNEAKFEIEQLRQSLRSSKGYEDYPI